MTAKDALERWQTMLSGFYEEADNAIKDKYAKRYIEALQSQLLAGKMPDGSETPSYANPHYGIMKMNMNPAADGNTDLKLTGSFHAQMYVESTGDTYSIKSRDSKYPKLSEKYGEQILTVGKPGLDDFGKRYLWPWMRRYIRRTTRFKFS